jgi:prostamide/prostaglandin F2alpha synthase
VQLHRARSEFEAAGVRLVLIGQATPRHAAHFRRRLGIELPVLVDQRRESYRAAGAKVATFGELLGPKSVGVGVTRAVRSGGKVRQGRTIGHPAQLGGAMVIAPDGAVAWCHMSEDASDNAPAEDILEAGRRAAVAA